MSKIFTALLLALSLTAAVACDEPDDKNIERSETGDESTGGEDDSTTTDSDTPEVQTTTATTEDDDEKPGCFNGNILELPPTGGPNGTIGDDC
ncbi:hypothetical protein SAMN02745121_05154 [Nannocystis exedens]|uniref:Uncharacterized protein n=1 Tax=Nannocystis exedens TaxID=54 RepID=A0A1I2CHX4_9BACT|nr:hypothetical protein [Nannocystis exedens]PCC68278.1 hypothetical protein NAEX_01288 [Nannocystis exedens]SFE67947.1 hypothetical protein SAMN02745121_05154 [Nannocystis exedens]